MGHLALLPLGLLLNPWVLAGVGGLLLYWRSKSGDAVGKVTAIEKVERAPSPDDISARIVSPGDGERVDFPWLGGDATFTARVEWRNIHTAPQVARPVFVVNWTDGTEDRWPAPPVTIPAATPAGQPGGPASGRTLVTYQVPVTAPPAWPLGASGATLHVWLAPPGRVMRDLAAVFVYAD